MMYKQLMNNLISLTNDQLHNKTLLSAVNEKTATLVLLEHLAEIDRRRLHATLGYSSLWEYVHKALQYSEAQTSDRVSAMRLMIKVPEVKQALETGTLTLTATAKLGAHAWREKLKPEQTVSLLQEISGKSSREVERTLISKTTVVNPVSIKSERIKPITDSLTRITIEVDEEFMELVEKVKNIKGNPAASLQDIFKATLREYVKKREVKLPTTKPVKT